MAEHLTKLGLTPYHIANLETLRDFLKSNNIPPPQFDIRYYLNNKEMLTPLLDKHDKSYSEIIDKMQMASNAPKYYNECGTTACAVGHGPLAGIPAMDTEDWNDYCFRVFGVTGHLAGTDAQEAAWTFMFGPMWTGKNNTAKGAAARIDWFLTHGTPEKISYWDNGAPWLVGLDIA